MDMYPIFKTSIMCCDKRSRFSYSTNLYPIYLIINSFKSVYDLFYLQIEYVK